MLTRNDLYLRAIIEAYSSIGADIFMRENKDPDIMRYLLLQLINGKWGSYNTDYYSQVLRLISENTRFYLYDLDSGLFISERGLGSL